MRSIRGYAGLTIGTGVLVGLGIIGWIRLHPAEEQAAVSSGGSVALDMSPTPTPASELQVRPAGSDTVQGTVVGGGSNAAGGGTSSASSAGAAAPAPSDFKQYDQYKSSEGTMMGEIKIGDGAAVAVGSVVTVNYKGWLTSGELFDESAAGQPFTFTEGEHRVISGWEQGLFGMKAGGKRRLIVPPAFGYGDQAHGPIPAGSVLVFDVELVSVK